MGRVGLDELVEEEDALLGGCVVEEQMGVLEVRDFKKLHDEDFGVVYAVSESVGMDLLHLVHKSL